MEKREPSYTVGMNVNWWRHYGESMEAPYKTKNRATTWSGSQIPGRISGENHNSKRHINSMFIEALLQLPGYGSNANVQQHLNG